MNLSYEDKSVFPSGFSHRTIYPWSLDGLNQEHIYKMLMFMMTAYNAYIAGGQSLLQAYVLITQGFNGILQGWRPVK